MSEDRAARWLAGPRPGVLAPDGSVALRAPDHRAAPAPSCNRCGFVVYSRPWGCKNPCPNCGTVYPLGDCSD